MFDLFKFTMTMLCIQIMALKLQNRIFKYEDILKCKSYIATCDIIFLNSRFWKLNLKSKKEKINLNAKTPKKKCNKF